MRLTNPPWCAKSRGYAAAVRQEAVNSMQRFSSQQCRGNLLRRCARPRGVIDAALLAFLLAAAGPGAPQDRAGADSLEVLRQRLTELRWKLVDPAVELETEEGRWLVAETRALIRRIRELERRRKIEEEQPPDGREQPPDEPVTEGGAIYDWVLPPELTVEIRLVAATSAGCAGEDPHSSAVLG